MDGRKIRLGILFGGRSAEHEVSLASARSVIAALDREKYDLFLIGIDKGGKWRLFDSADYLIHPEDPKQISLGIGKGDLALLPKEGGKEIVTMLPTSCKALLNWMQFFLFCMGLGRRWDGTRGVQVGKYPFCGSWSIRFCCRDG